MKGFIALLILFFSVSTTYAQKDKPAITSYADSLMQLKYKANAPGAVLLIAKDGYPIFEKAYGMANMELRIPNRTDYEFEIGSNTKQFTAVAILQLVQEGKLDLQDNLHKYIPWYNTYGKQITIENLLTHTSGIPSYTEEKGFADIVKKDLSKDSIMRWTMKDSLLFDPGTNWSYSNTGFYLLGMIIEKVTGESYEDYVQQHILNPLHMRHTYFGTSSGIIPGLVNGYAGAGKEKYKDAIPFSWSSVFSAGAIISNVEDMLKWDQALYTTKLVNQNLLKKAWTNYTLKNNKKTGYGYGWFVTNYKGLRFIWHGGAVPGFLSAVIRMPEQHIYIALLSNNAMIAPTYVPFLIAAKLGGKPLKKLPKAIKVSPELLGKDTGVYQVEALGGRLVANLTSEKIYRYITLENDTLFTQITGDAKFPMRPIGKDLFMIADQSDADSLLYTTYYFIKDGQDAVKAIAVKSNLNISMVRTEPKTSLPLPKKDKKTIQLPSDLLQQYVGKYNYKSVFNITISVKGDKIYAQGDGQKTDEIFPENKTTFFSKTADYTITFQKDKSGKVTGFLLDQAGKHEFKKVK